MLLKEKELYEFGEFRLDVAEHFLERLSGGERIQLSEKAFETLCVLVRSAGHLIRKDELMNQVWADSFVEENNLDKCIYAIRKALGEKPGAQKYIETVRKHGYRFIVEVRRIEEEIKPIYKESAISSEAKIPRQTFPRRVEQTETQNTRAVIALADWRHETDKNQPQESTGQTVKLELVPAKPIVQSDPKYRALVVAGLILGIIGLGYYFFSASKTASGADGKKSIAVLPLKPIGTATRDELYEIGIADSLIARLNLMKGFTIRPLSATRQYADIEQDAIAAGKEQQVDYVLASNYQLANGKIKITAQLFNVASGQIEETYKIEKDAGNIFAMQDAIAGEVGNVLQTRFATTSSSPKTMRGTTNEEAYRLYLQGTALADKRTQTEVSKAVDYFEQAIRLDPNYALAYARLANAQTALSFSGDTYEKAKAAIEKALAIDDNLAEAHSYSGEIKSDFDWDFAGAEREHRKAIELNPNSSVAHRMYALLLSYLGRFDESLAEINTAIDLEPASVLNHLIFGRILLFARRYNEAVTALERTAEMDPEFFFAHLSLSNAYRFKGDDDRAFESFMKTEILAGDEPDEINSWKTIYAKSGWQGILARQFEQAKEAEKNGKPNYDQLANLSSELGQREQAFAYLEKTFVKHRWAMVMLNIHPRYDSLRPDPRFDDLVRRVGLK